MSKWKFALTLLVIESSVMAQETSLPTVEQSLPQIQEISQAKKRAETIASPVVSEYKDVSEGFFFNGEYLYWFVREDGLDFAQKGAQPGDSFFTSKTVFPNFNWNSGFKVGAGYHFSDSDRWDAHLNWTWMRGRASNEIEVPTTTLSEVRLVPYWFPSLIGSIASFAEAQWRLKYNTIDLEIGKSYFPSRKILLRPYVGARSAITREKYTVDYFAFHVTQMSILPSPASFEAKYDFTSVGIRSGFDAQWFFLPSWGIYGGASGALLFGEVETRYQMSGGRLTTGPIVDPTTYQAKDEFWSMRPNLELMAGFQFDDFYNEGKFHFAARIGYQMSYWFNQNPLLSVAAIQDSFGVGGGDTAADQYFAITRMNGDMNLQGLVASLLFDF